MRMVSLTNLEFETSKTERGPQTAKKIIDHEDLLTGIAIVAPKSVRA
jgi:hypothetical protein